MRRLLGLSLFTLINSCGVDQEASRLAASREARYLLKAPEKLSDDFWQRLKNPSLPRDFLLQRQIGWNLWAELLRTLPGPAQKNFMVWQGWYGREDLQRIFRRLYEGLGISGRRARRPFFEQDIQDGLRWNDRQQFEEGTWDAQRFEKWLATFDSDEKQRSIPGMQKILFNEVALSFLLQNYQRLEVCQKERQRQGTCESLAWPEQAVFLKTSWRRSEQGFLVEHFATDPAALSQHWEKTQWTASQKYEPAAGASMALRLPSGQKFHLTGLHASLRLDDHWYWTSLWLGSGAREDLASDQADTLESPWTSYRLCSVDGWHEPLRQPSIDSSWPPEIAALGQFQIEKQAYSWCSNPYLEPGPNNQKTNCIGCHQHAGLNWTQSDIRKRLMHDLPSLIQKTSQSGPADFVWSLYAGPEPLIQPLMDDIEFFDVYDPFP